MLSVVGFLLYEYWIMEKTTKVLPGRKEDTKL